MTTATLVATILQLAMTILAGVSKNPNITPTARDQAVSIAQQAVNFANQNMPYLNTVNTTVYNPNTGGQWHAYYPNGTEVHVMILSAGNIDTSNLVNGAVYNVVWSPYDPSQGYVDAVLYSSALGNVQTLAHTNLNNTPWTVSAAAGTYELRVIQNGGVLVGRTITISG